MKIVQPLILSKFFFKKQMSISKSVSLVFTCADSSSELCWSPFSVVFPSVCLSVNFTNFPLPLQNHWPNFNQPLEIIATVTIRIKYCSPQQLSILYKSYIGWSRFRIVKIKGHAFFKGKKSQNYEICWRLLNCCFQKPLA